MTDSDTTRTPSPSAFASAVAPASTSPADVPDTAHEVHEVVERPRTTRARRPRKQANPKHVPEATTAPTPADVNERALEDDAAAPIASTAAAPEPTPVVPENAHTADDATTDPSDIIVPTEVEPDATIAEAPTSNSSPVITGAELLGESDDGNVGDDDKVPDQDNDDSDDDPSEEESPRPSRRRQAAPGTPIPTKGMAALDYRLWRLGIPLLYEDYRPPQMGRREFAEYRRKQEIVDDLVRELRDLAATVERIIAVRNSKGGSGKSPLAANLATVLMWAIDMLVILADTNDNDGSGHLRLGIERESTKSLMYVMYHLNKFTCYRDLCHELGTPAARGKGVMLIASGAGSTADFDKALFIQTMLRLWLSAHSIVEDTGNGNTVPSVAASVDAATDIVITTMADKDESFKKAVSTLAAHYNQGFVDKVRSSFIAVNATHPGDTREMYLKKLRAAVAKLTVEDIAPGSSDDRIKTSFTLEDLGVSVNSIYLIPFDQYVKDEGVADVASLQLDTLIAYLELLVAIFKQNAPAPKLKMVPDPYHRDDTSDQDAPLNDHVRQNTGDPAQLQPSAA